MQPGTRLGPYEILSPIGAGGMGQVYRARDTRLDRDVAIKVLPEEFFEDEERKRRFEREAKLLASVSHPNIAAIHSFEEISGRCLLVQELLEGEPLRRLVLADGPLPVRRALDVAGQIAEALAAAHENGIVHRDVKPENVFIGPDGRVKLLDFSLARNAGSHREASDTRSPTVTDVSRPGSVAGTVAYMSPEQAKGEPVDYRSDQFSLGIVLYEMLTGLRPFRGGSNPETLTSIIREEPEPLEKLAPTVPGPVRWIVERCLAKEPDGRFDSTRDLTRDLATCRAHLSEASSIEAAAARSSRPRRILARWAPWALAALAAAVALAFARKQASRGERFDIELPGGYLLRARGGHAFDISPDGRQIVFAAFSWKTPYVEAGPSQLFIRPLDAFEATRLPGTESVIDPVYSPDGRWIAFSAGNPEKPTLRKIPAEGGTPITLCECVATGGIAWVGVDAVVFGSAFGGPLQRVPAAGGKPEPITRLDKEDGEVSHRLPHVLPDGNTLVYTAMRYALSGTAWERARIYTQRLGSEKRSLLMEGGSDGRWAPPGVLLFAKNGTLFAARFSSSDLSRTDSPVPILEGVRHSIGVPCRYCSIGAAQVAVTENGGLVYARGSVEPERARVLVWVDEKGGETPIDLPKQSYLSINLSPDGKQLLVTHNYPGQQVEVLDLERGARRKVTFAGSHPWAIWGPGPGKVTFVSDHEGPWRLYSHDLEAPPDQVETLWRGTGRDVFLGSWSPDGKILAFTARSEAGDNDVWILERGKEARPLLATRFWERCPEISPDGRWLLYVSNELGESEVLVRPLDGTGPAKQVSIGGGQEPVWARDGKSVFYKKYIESTTSWAGRGPVAIYRVWVKESTAGLEFERPEKLFDGDYGAAEVGRDWDVSPDGRFLLDKPASRDETKAFFDQIYPSRIRVDLGGVPRLMAQVEKIP